MTTIPVVVQGLGGLGRAAIEVCGDTPGVHLAAVVTRRPDAAVDLPPGVEVLPDLTSAGRAHPGAIVLSTVHALADELEEVLGDAVRAGLDVVTSSGLFHPPTQAPDGGGALDRLAREGSARVLASGVQPGFLLDVLPAMLLDLAPGWTDVVVRKPSDSRSWPVPTRHVLGIGEPTAVVESSVPYPLAASAHLLADAVGRPVVALDETRRASTLAHALVLAEETIPAGHAVGFVQECVAELDGGRGLRLRWEPSVAVTDETELSLQIDVSGGADLSLRLDGSFHRDPYPATAARMLNTAVRARSLAPGLHLDVSPGLAWPAIRR